MKSMKRVVVTGMGAITPIGNSVEEFWNGIKEQKIGFAPITYFDATEYKAHLAAEVKGFNAKDYMSPKAARRMELFSQYAVAATKEAIEDAGLDLEKEDTTRIGVSVGCGVGSLQMIETTTRTLDKKGPNRVKPLAVPMMISNMAAGNVSIAFGLRGKSINVVTACATGTQSIGEAYRSIQVGEADVMVAGGTEAAVSEVAVGGFAALTALSGSDDPKRASIPFDKERDGFVIGEGSGIVVLESLEHAQARGADILAEVVGYGQTADAYDVVAPDPEGKGATNSMKFALEDAGLKPQDVDYINAHGTSTGLGDIAESKAIEGLFGSKDENKKLLVSSTKSMHGHLLGATGAVECIACIKSINEGIVPPTINLDNQDEKVGNLDYVPHKARKADIHVALSNSFGFGGQNASVVIKEAE